MTKVLDEHYAYLSLAQRTQLFRDALDQAVQPGDVVADLGCGFGILGLMALEAGASRCFGIDSSDAIEIARETVRREGLQDRYTAIRGSTFRTTLDEPVDLLVCDHVGYFGIDYGIIAMLDDARQRLLKPGGRIMPAAMTLQVCAVESAPARARADRWIHDDMPAAFRWIHEQGINAEHALQFAPEECLSVASSIAAIDFSQPAADTLNCTVELEMTRDGQFDGLAGSFTCQLVEGVELTNDPQSGRSFGRPQAFLPCRESFPVRAGDKVTARLSIRHDPLLLSWTITPPDDGPAQAMSTWHSTILTEADLARDMGQKLSRNPIAEARQALLQLLDGTRSADEIEAEMLARHAQLFPSAAELRRFVRRELPGNSK